MFLFFLYKNLKIIGQEGNLPYSYWSNFNYNHEEYNLIPNVQILLDLINNANFYSPLLINCANPLLLEQDFYDCRSNKTLELFNNGSNKIIISDPKFGEYLLEKYNFFTLIGDENY